MGFALFYYVCSYARIISSFILLKVWKEEYEYLELFGHRSVKLTIRKECSLYWTSRGIFQVVVIGLNHLCDVFSSLMKKKTKNLQHTRAAWLGMDHFWNLCFARSCWLAFTQDLRLKIHSGSQLLGSDLHCYKYWINIALENFWHIQKFSSCMVSGVTSVIGISFIFLNS